MLFIKFIEKINSLRENKILKEEQYLADLKEYQLALTVVLVDMAMVDNDFDYKEHSFILNQITQRFALSKDDVYALINEAESIITQNYDVDSYGKTLRKFINAEEQEAVMMLLDKLIMIDNERNPYEIKLRQRYEKLLGVRVKM